MRVSAAFAAASTIACVFTTRAAAAPRNVLYLIADDFRAEIASWLQDGDTILQTPNLDKLARTGLSFKSAVTAAPVCDPARSSFMTGRRPAKTRVWHNTGSVNFRIDGKGDPQSWRTMPGYFKDEANRITIGGGKTFHPNCPKDFDGDKSWDNDFLQYFDFSYYVEGDGHCPNHAKGSKAGGASASEIDTWCVLDLPDDSFYDHRLANHTIEALHKAHDAGKPFAIFAGFARPHVPLRVPQRIWDMYGPANDSSHIAPAKYQGISEDYPPIAYHRQGHYKYNNFTVPTLPNEIYAPNFTDITVPLHIQQTVRRAYYSSITWMDEQLGRILDELESLGLDQDTAVVIHGDHGYRIGENNQYMKEQLGEQVARVPLIVRAPWYPQTAGRATLVKANLVDMYATLADLIEGPEPSQKDELDGASLAWVFQDPSHSVPLEHAATEAFAAEMDARAREQDAPERLLGLAEHLRSGGLPNGTASFTQYPHCSEKPSHGSLPEWWNTDHCESYDTEYMGYSVRTSRWRYIEWREFSSSTNSSSWDGTPHAEQLYDHAGDVGSSFDGPWERVNLAGQPAHKQDQEALAQVLEAFFKPAQDPSFGL